MSIDTMAAFDEGLEEARKIVLRHMKLRTCGEEDCEVCPVVLRKRRRILAAITRARQQPR